jgi:hypothetical protein
MNAALQFDAPRIQHRTPSSISPVLRLRAGPIAGHRYRINYHFAGEPCVEGEIIQPTQEAAWALWRSVLAAHERGAA